MRAIEPDIPDAAQAEARLYAFLQQAWPVIEPGTPLKHNWHLELICEYLEAVSAGAIRRLIINEPPRSLKSLVVSVCWPDWCWIRQPELRWMFTSYSASLATFHSLTRRTLLTSDWYRRHWGGRFALRKDQNQKTEFANSQGGIMIATSVGGSATGKGGDILVMDDPLNPQEALSELERETANRWIRQSFLTRLNDPRTGALVLVMQRLHEEDTTGLLLGMGEWEHLRLPAAAEDRQHLFIPSANGARSRSHDEILFPGREGHRELARRRRELGSYGFAGQYQQRPAPVEGGIFKRHWWRFWYPAAAAAPPPVTVLRDDGSLVSCAQCRLPERFDEEILSWDMAFKGLQGSDYVVGQCWGRRDAEKYLLDQAREHADFPQVIKLMLQMVARHPRVDAVLVEDAANGPAVLQVLRRDVAGMIPVTPEGGKTARAHAVAAGVEAGNIFLPHPALFPWVEAFIERASAFPNVAHDDEIDAMTQALLRLKKHDALWPFPPDAPQSEEAQWEETLRHVTGAAPPRSGQAGW